MIFFVDKFCWNICFLTKSLFRITKFCFQVVKFVWRAPKVWASFSRPNVRHTLWQRRHRKDLTLLISFRERIISKFVISITKTSKQNRDPKFPFSISWNFHGSPTSIILIIFYFMIANLRSTKFQFESFFTLYSCKIFFQI